MQNAGGSSARSSSIAGPPTGSSLTPSDSAHFTAQMCLKSPEPQDRATSPCADFSSPSAQTSSPSAETPLPSQSESPQPSPSAAESSKPKTSPAESSQSSSPTAKAFQLKPSPAESFQPESFPAGSSLSKPSPPDSLSHPPGFCIPQAHPTHSLAKKTISADNSDSDESDEDDFRSSTEAETATSTSLRFHSCAQTDAVEQARRAGIEKLLASQASAASTSSSRASAQRNAPNSRAGASGRSFPNRQNTLLGSSQPSALPRRRAQGQGSGPDPSQSNQLGSRASMSIDDAMAQIRERAPGGQQQRAVSAQVDVSQARAASARAGVSQARASSTAQVDVPQARANAAQADAPQRRASSAQVDVPKAKRFCMPRIQSVPHGFFEKVPQVSFRLC